MTRATTDGMPDSQYMDAERLRQMAAQKLLDLSKDKSLKLSGDECLAPIIESLHKDMNMVERAKALEYLMDVPQAPPAALMPKLQTFLLASLEEIPAGEYARDLLARWGDRSAIPGLRIAVMAQDNPNEKQILEKNLHILEARNP